METLKELVSVVIPVYNVEKYLRRCLDSVINQTYRNLQIIVVDDGSTDRSSSICDEYAKKDKRIEVVHKENGGLSDARNSGIDIATGSYITFIDSDDFVTKDYVEYLYTMLINSHADISIVSNKKIWDLNESVDKNIVNKELLFSGIEALENLCYQKNIENSAWAKLYSVELFKDIRYPVGRLYEDLGTTYKLFWKARKVVWSNQQKYLYLQRDTSIMRRKFSSKNIDRIIVSQEILTFVFENIPNIVNAAISRFFISNMQVLRELPLQDCKYTSIQYEIKNNIKKYRKVVLLDKKAKRINRIIALSSYMPLVVIQKIGECYKKING